MTEEIKVDIYTFSRDGRAEWIGDSGHRGTEVFWSQSRRRWVLVDLENETVGTAERIAAVRCLGDPDDGLNQNTLACDLDGQGLWIVDANYCDECADGYLEVVAVG
jgi:hypothetical protein